MSALSRALLAELLCDEDALRELAERLAPLLPAPAPAEDRWMASKEAAAYLGMSVFALRREMARGDLPYVQRVRGGKVWLRRSELDRWREDAGPAGARVTRQ